jgi:hypothetical protein
VPEETREAGGPGRETRGTDRARPATVEPMDLMNPVTGQLPAGARRDDTDIRLVELRKLRLERVVLVGVAVGGSIEASERSI